MKTIYQKSNRILLFSVFLMIAVVTNAQPGLDDDDKNEKIEALHVSFITNRLNLSVAEAQTFWPVYNAMTDEMKTLRKKFKDDEKGVYDNFDALSDQELSDYSDKYIQFQQDEVDVRKKYHEEFKKVLPPRKVALLYKSELEFKLLLVNMMKKKQGD